MTGPRGALEVVGVRVSVQHKATTTTTAAQKNSESIPPPTLPAATTTHNEAHDESNEYASATPSNLAARPSLNPSRRAMDGWLELMRQRKRTNRHETIADLHSRFLRFKFAFEPWKQLTATQHRTRVLKRNFRRLRTATSRLVQQRNHAELIIQWRSQERLREVLLEWRQAATKQKRAFDTHLLAGLFRWQVLVGGVFERWKQKSAAGAAVRDRAVLHWANGVQRRVFAAWRVKVAQRKATQSAACHVISQRASTWLAIWRQAYVAERHWKQRAQRRVLSVNLPRAVDEGRKMTRASQTWRASSQRRFLRNLRVAVDNRRVRVAREHEAKRHMDTVRARSALQFWLEHTKSRAVQRVALVRADAHFVRSRIWKWQTWAIDRHSSGVLRLVADRHYSRVLGAKVLNAWRAQSELQMTVLVLGARAIERRAWGRWRRAAAEGAALRRQQLSIIQWRRHFLQKRAVVMMLTAAARQWDVQERQASEREMEERARVMKYVAKAAAHWRALVARRSPNPTAPTSSSIHAVPVGVPAPSYATAAAAAATIRHSRGRPTSSYPRQVRPVASERASRSLDQGSVAYDTGDGRHAFASRFDTSTFAAAPHLPSPRRRLRASPRRGPWVEEDEPTA